jgi:hypothetical protein
MEIVYQPGSLNHCSSSARFRSEVFSLLSQVANQKCHTQVYDKVLALTEREVVESKPLSLLYEQHLAHLRCTNATFTRAYIILAVACAAALQNRPAADRRLCARENCPI